MGTIRKIIQSNAPPSVVLIRSLVGVVFLSEGIQKFPSDLAAGRFAKIGIPAPEITGPFVGVIEILCGALIIIGLLTRLASLPLILICSSRSSRPRFRYCLAMVTGVSA